MSSRRVADLATEHHQHVVHIERLHHRVGTLLSAGHAQTDGGDVRVVASVVVDDDGAVAHARDLVAVVPPRHDLRVGHRVLSQPGVRLAEVVEDDQSTVVALCLQYDGRARVGRAGHPVAVDGEEEEQQRHSAHHQPEATGLLTRGARAATVVKEPLVARLLVVSASLLLYVITSK